MSFESQHATSFLLVINSNLSPRFRDIAVFSVENAHFSTPFPFNPEFEKVSLALIAALIAEILYIGLPGNTRVANYSCKKFPLRLNCYTVSQDTSVTYDDEQSRHADRRRQPYHKLDHYLSRPYGWLIILNDFKSVYFCRVGVSRIEIRLRQLEASPQLI